MNKLANRLKLSIEKALPNISEISPLLAAEKPNPIKWSRKEILGHLIDSASNNHQRFVRIQMKDDLIFQGYTQDDWVKAQDYQNKEWKKIITLWYAYNEHLAFAIEMISEDILNKKRTNHNLHQIAYKPIPQNEPTTLAYFINDYIDHLEFHLGQILDYPY